MGFLNSTGTVLRTNRLPVAMWTRFLDLRIPALLALRDFSSRRRAHPSLFVAIDVNQSRIFRRPHILRARDGQPADGKKNYPCGQPIPCHNASRGHDALGGTNRGLLGGSPLPEIRSCRIRKNLYVVG